MRDIYQPDKPFSGKVVLVGGNFRQCLPVLCHGTQTDIMMACVKESNFWPQFEKLQLSIYVRAQENNTGYAEWLLQMNNGTLEGVRRDRNTFECVDRERISEFTTISSTTWSHFNTLQCGVRHDQQMCLQPFVWCPPQLLQFRQQVEDENIINHYTLEFLYELTSGCLPHLLQLKKVVIVIVLRNINVRNAICNGILDVWWQIHRRTLPS